MFRKIKAAPRMRTVIIGCLVVILLGFAGTASQPKQANVQTRQIGDKAVLGAETTANEERKAPVVTTKTETETQPIPFTSTTVTDPTLASGSSRVTIVGKDGVSTLTYKVTYTDGVQTDKQLESQVATIQPVTQVTAIGTYVAPRRTVPAPAVNTSCDPNYTGCVPIASDVDCAGGSGNGPAYAYGPVQVIGSDIYDLDRDGDGWACE